MTASPRLQFLFRPHGLANPRAGASSKALYTELLAMWLQAFPSSIESDEVDLEDWTENAIQLRAALHSTRHLDIFLDLARGGRCENTVPLPASFGRHSPEPGVAFDFRRPFVFGGAVLRIGDRINESRTVTSPTTQEELAAAAYYWNRGFWAHAGRKMSFATFDDGQGDTPLDENLIEQLKARRDAGDEFAMVKVCASKRGVTRIPLKGQTDKSISKSLVDRFDWTLIETAGRKDAYLVQDFVAMTHEYRVFVVDGVPVAGAGCVEEHTPMDNDGSAFDVKTRRYRTTEVGQPRDSVLARPDIVEAYRRALPLFVGDLIAARPEMRTFVVDLCMVNGKPAIVELNGMRNSGEYALDYAAVLEAKFAALEKRLAAEAENPPTPAATLRLRQRM
jgi:hypothetical protein